MHKYMTRAEVKKIEWLLDYMPHSDVEMTHESIGKRFGACRQVVDAINANLRGLPSAKPRQYRRQEV